MAMPVWRLKLQAPTVLNAQKDGEPSASSPGRRPL